MLRTLYRYQARKAEDDSEVGFTLIELLIVIVVLGILAAVTVFALSGVSSTSAQAACNSDASSVNTAIADYTAANPGGAAPTQALLTATTGTQYLQSWPTSSHYVITIVPNATATGYVPSVNGNASSGPSIPWAPGTGNLACASTNVK